MNRPHIIKSDILATLDTYEQAVNELGLQELDRRMAVDHIDMMAVKAMMTDAQVILFSAEQALALRPALQRFGEALEYRLPFRTLFIQFTQPIPESAFFTPEPTDQPGSAEFLQNMGLTDGDKICGMVLDQEEKAEGK